MARALHIEVFMNAQQTKALFGVYPVAIMTLRCTVEEGYRPSYMSDLIECVRAGLCVFPDPVRGGPVLTEKGRRALAVCR